MTTIGVILLAGLAFFLFIFFAIPSRYLPSRTAVVEVRSSLKVDELVDLFRELSKIPSWRVMKCITLLSPGQVVDQYGEKISLPLKDGGPGWMEAYSDWSDDVYTWQIQSIEGSGRVRLYCVAAEIDYKEHLMLEFTPGDEGTTIRAQMEIREAVNLFLLPWWIIAKNSSKLFTSHGRNLVGDLARGPQIRPSS